MSHRASTTRPSPAPTSEARILDAASALARSGVRLTIDAVATELGVSRATIYRRYPDREALVAALVSTGRLESEPIENDLRERILDAVDRVLKKKGFGGTTIEAVASEASVGVATVYRKFHDRRQLLRAFVAERTPRRLGRRLGVHRGDPAAGLRRIASETIGFLREHRELMPLLLGVDPEAKELLAEVRAGSTSFREISRRFIHACFHDPDGRKALVFQGMVTAIAAAPDGDADQDADFVTAGFLRGFGRKVPR